MRDALGGGLCSPHSASGVISAANWLCRGGEAQQFWSVGSYPNLTVNGWNNELFALSLVFSLTNQINTFVVNASILSTQNQPLPPKQ